MQAWSRWATIAKSRCNYSHKMNTTGFSMPCYKKNNQRVWLAVFRLVCFFSLAAGVQAQGIEVKSAELELNDNAYYLNASFDVQLNSTLEDVVNHGVPLYFVTECSLKRERWYWFDKKLASVTQQFKLSYNALTRQYRLSVRDLFQNFDTLSEAVAVLSRVHNRHVIDRDALETGKPYVASVKMWMDISQLPKPFQVNALASQEWNLSSSWYSWTLTP